MGKNDWKKGKLPVFDSQKYGVVHKDPTDPTKRLVIDPASLANNNAEIIPTPDGGRAQGFMPHFIDGSDAS